MMDREQAIEFAVSSARMAIDQQQEFTSRNEAVDSYRDNVMDTLNDEKANEFVDVAFRAFDAEVNRLVG